MNTVHECTQLHNQYRQPCAAVEVAAMNTTNTVMINTTEESFLAALPHILVNNNGYYSYTSKSDYVATAAMHPRLEPHLQVLNLVNRPLLATYWHFSCSQSCS